MGARRKIAEWLNELGRRTNDSGKNGRAVRLYDLASRFDPRWSVPYYNSGLIWKYARDWAKSLELNRRALELDPDDEAACWNLGIAATALRDWNQARSAWRKYGINVEDGEGEVAMPRAAACVRLNPKSDGEVVWGERLDPARFLICNVPLPESRHRFHDIVLNDGAATGTRTSNGVEVSVFDELAVWQPSYYSTYESTLLVPDSNAEETLTTLCADRKIGIEDWSTIRWICAECSRGNPGPHDCQNKEQRRTFGFAALTEDDLLGALSDWKSRASGSEYGETKLVLDARA